MYNKATCQTVLCNQTLTNNFSQDYHSYCSTIYEYCCLHRIHVLTWFCSS